MAKTRGTDGSLLSSLPWTLVALGVAAVPHLPYLPPWVSAVAIGCAAWRFLIEKRRSLLPPTLARGVFAIACFLGILFTFETISGVGPGTALLAVMAALKLLETRERRDQFVLLFIAIFLVMASMLREQYLWSLPYMLVSLVVTLSAWLRMSAPATQPPRASVLAAARFLAYAAPFAVALWIFFPRIASPFWAVPIDTSSGMTGLSDTMSPGDITSLSQSDAVAFRVRFDEITPLPRDRYWRALVLDRFNGRSWSGRTEPMPDFRYRERVEYFGDAIDYQVILEPMRTQWLMSLDVAESWQLKGASMSRWSQALAFNRPIDQRLAYNVRSYPDYRIERETGPYRASWYLEMPDDRNPRAVAFARELRAAVDSDEAYIDAVLGRFNQEDFYYTLEPPALGANPVDSFLFDTRQGFCEHYASAFAVLMRAAGIPARIVVGYQGGETNPLGDYMIVRQADAHAWTEVWLDGVGWRRFDPTAAVAPERIEDGRSASIFAGAGEAWGLSAPSRIAYQLGLTLDALNARWNEFVLGYGAENQERFMRWLGIGNPDWRNLLLLVVGLVVTLTAVIHLLLIARFRPPRRDEARRLYARFVRKTRLESTRGETPLEFLERLGSPAEARSITALYLDSRYGGGGEEALAALKAAVRRYRHRPA